MTYSPDTPIIGPPTGTLSEALAWLDIKPGAEAEYVTELWRLCELVDMDFAVLFAQSAHETGDFSSYWWQYRRNPAGIGITGDKKQNQASQTWANGVDAARAHVIHMCAYVFGNLSGSPERQELLPFWGIDQRWNAVFDAGFEVTVRTLSDLTGKWATDPKYAEKIVAKANSIFRWGITPQEVTPSMATIVAQPCPIEIAVVWTGENRPGLAMHSPSKIVTHEVGNKSPGADEEMHKRFVHAGGGQYKVSFHFVVGPSKIVQLLYLDENAWHASDGYTGDGNRDGWGIEHIQIGDFNKTLAHGAWLQAELVRNPRRFAIKNPAAFVPDITRANVRDRMVRHYDEAPDKKYCPEQIMNRGLWEPLKDAVVAELDKTVPAPKPENTPYPIPWEEGDVGPQKLNNYPATAFLYQLTAKKQATRRVGASSDSPTFGAKIAVGEKVTGIGTVLVPSGQRLQQWHILSDGARVPASVFEERLPKP